MEVCCEPSRHCRGVFITSDVGNLGGLTVTAKVMKGTRDDVAVGGVLGSEQGLSFMKSVVDKPKRFTEAFDVRFMRDGVTAIGTTVGAVRIGCEVPVLLS